MFYHIIQQIHDGVNEKLEDNCTIGFSVLHMLVQVSPWVRLWEIFFSKNQFFEFHHFLSVSLQKFWSPLIFSQNLLLFKFSLWLFWQNHHPHLIFNFRSNFFVSLLVFLFHCSVFFCEKMEKRKLFNIYCFNPLKKQDHSHVRKSWATDWQRQLAPDKPTSAKVCAACRMELGNLRQNLPSTSADPEVSFASDPSFTCDP